MTKRIIVAASLVLGALLFASSAHAKPGIRAGITNDIDSFFFGFQYEVPLSYSHTGIAVVEPSVDLGFGDLGNLDIITVRGAFHFKYLFRLHGQPGAFFYPLGGLSIYYLNFQDCTGNCDNTSTGIDLGAGFRFRRFSFELWAGIDDVPDITFAIAWRF